MVWLVVAAFVGSSLLHLLVTVALARFWRIAVGPAQFGMGPRLLTLRVAGVEWRIAAIPYGSFVRLGAEPATPGADSVAHIPRGRSFVLSGAAHVLCILLGAGLARTGSPALGALVGLIGAVHLCPLPPLAGWAMLTAAVPAARRLAGGWMFTLFGGLFAFAASAAIAALAISRPEAVEALGRWLGGA